MDRITNSLMENYIEENELDVSDESKKFEAFSCYSVISKEFNDTFEIDNIWLDDNAPGIDGIAIIVNGRIVDDKDEVDDLVDSNKYIDANFVFIQSKTSNNFDSGDIGKFLFAVSDFFEDTPSMIMTEKVKEKVEIMNHIYTKSSAMTKGNPVCKIYYVTTGTWANDVQINALFESKKQDLLRKNLFSNIITIPLGAREIQKYYQDTKTAISKDIIFRNRITLSEINGVDQAYIGTLEYDQFIKLVKDEEGKIINSVFYDNVRAFQGENNNVNKKIKETIENRDFDKFTILNNGITLVAKSVIVAGDKMTLFDYSIVNGCQTSHVLFGSNGVEGIGKVNVPVRLVVTNDEVIRNEIIRATNNQTEVKIEELEALSDFQRILESYYGTMRDDLSLFYERRSKQFLNDTSVTKSRIITIPIQIKSFAAIFLGEPHLVSRFYGRIIKDHLGTEIFLNGHKPIPYYVSALAYFRLDQLFRNHDIDAKYKKCRYHILMLMPYLIENIEKPALNSANIERYCQNIIKELETKEKSLCLFEKVVKVIKNSGINLDDRDVFKLQSTNELLLRGLV